MFSLIIKTVSVAFHKIYKNSFYPYFFICCYIQNCMFAKIFTIGHVVSLSSRWHHFPNDTEQSDWSNFFKTKIDGFWLTAPRDTAGLSWALCLSCVFDLLYSLIVALLFHAIVFAVVMHDVLLGSFFCLIYAFVWMFLHDLCCF